MKMQQKKAFQNQQFLIYLLHFLKIGFLKQSYLLLAIFDENSNFGFGT